MKPGPDRPSVDPPSAESGARAEPALVQPPAVPSELPRRTPTGTMRSAAANARLASVLEMIGDAFVAFDADLNYTYVNEKAAALFGRKAADLVGRNYWQEFPEARGTQFAEAYVRALQTGEPIQFESHFPPWDRWFENRVYPSADGLAIFFSEITDRKRAEEAVRRERDFSNALLDSLPGIFYLCDETPRLLRWNRNFERATGYTAAELAAIDVAALVPVEQRELLAERFATAFREGMVEGEGDLLAKDGTRTPFFFTGLRADVADRPWLIGVGIDVSRRRAAEAERERAEIKMRRLNLDLERRVAERTARLVAANKELEAFSYSVSHDLRAPLRAIGGFAEIIARRHGTSLPPEAQRYLGNILQASERMNQLIDALLGYSRLGHWAIRRESIPLGEVLASLQNDFAPRVQQSGGRLAVAADLPAVFGDRVLLEQLFGNLLDNALTYHSPRTPPEVTVSWSREGDDVVVRVSDRGIGIAPEHHEKIFDIFQRLQPEDAYPGTGVGLATVRKAADLLGGAVMVESAPGAGATFHVALPAADAAAAEAPPVAVPSATP